MIISDAHRFAFVHIPKCAGSAVRSQLQPYDSYHGRFSQKGLHPALGQIDFSHLPMAVLRDHFPCEFEKVSTYRSFAIIRNPHTRFLSAVLQYLQEFERVSHDTFRTEWVASQALRIADRLAGSEIKSSDLVHFTTQTAFIAVDGQRIVRDLFAFEDMAPLASTLSSAFGIGLDLDERTNKSLVPDRVPLQLIRRAVGPSYRRMVSQHVRNRINRAVAAARVINTQESLYERLIRKDDIRAFIDTYYADDLALHRSLSDGAESCA